VADAPRPSLRHPVEGRCEGQEQASHADRSSIWSCSTVPHRGTESEAKSWIFGVSWDDFTQVKRC